MTTKTEILKKLKSYKSINAKRYGIITIGVFGSYSRNEGNNDSDVDIVIKTKTPDLFQLVHIKDDLEKIFKTKVDVIRYRKNMNPYLLKQIDLDTIYV